MITIEQTAVDTEYLEGLIAERDEAIQRAYEAQCKAAVVIFDDLFSWIFEKCEAEGVKVKALLISGDELAEHLLRIATENPFSWEDLELTREQLKWIGVKLPK